MKIHDDDSRLKAYINELFQFVSSYKSDEGGILDTKFESQIKSMPWQSLLELELAKYLINLKLDIYSKDKGPDFQLKKLSVNESIWLEAVCPKEGFDNPNNKIKISDCEGDPDLDSHGIKSFPMSVPLRDPDYERRLTNALAEKAKKYQSYLNQGIVSSSDSCLIVISTDEIDSYGIPINKERIKSVLFNKSPVYEINVYGQSRRLPMELNTKNSKPISCNFFEDNPFITGVVHKDRNDFIYYSTEYPEGVSFRAWINNSCAILE